MKVGSTRTEKRGGGGSLLLQSIWQREMNSDACLGFRSRFCELFGNLKKGHRRYTGGVIVLRNIWQRQEWPSDFPF